MGWEWTSNVRDHVFGPIKDKRDVDAFIVDTQGKVVMSRVPGVPVGTELDTLLQKARGPAQQFDWPDKKAYLTTVAPVAPQGGFTGFGWKVVARQDPALALGAARDLRNAFILGAIGLGLTAALLAWLIAGRLTRPIRELANAVRAGHDASLASVASMSRMDEVQHVARAMTTLSNSARQQEEVARTKDRQFAALAESLPQVVWQADADGKLEYVNKKWLLERLETTAMNVQDLVHVMDEEDCPQFTAAWRQSMTTGDELKVRCRLHQAEGAQPAWHDIEAQPVKTATGQVSRWVGTIFDVHESVVKAETTEKRLEFERGAREEAERLSRMRDEFMATVSHELRSPLSAITGWAEILARKANADETLTKAAAVIRRNAMLQARLIDDLLDMTAVMAGKLTLSESVFDLSALTKEATLSMLHAAQQKGVALTCAEALPAMVCGDSRRISQVLANLIGNAIKFTDAGGSVEVSQWSSDGRAAVRVKDTGRGISAGFLPHVFDRLRQEDASKSRKAGGLGIGLAIAKAVVELHHGVIQADSIGVGAGSEFTFVLPLADDGKETSDQGDVSQPNDVDLSGVSILLVDDEKDAREVGQIALISMGADVALAASATDALSVLEHKRFDLIVSDIGMPVMDGLSFIRAVRSGNSPNADTTAVALSAFALVSEKQEGLAAGFDAYVTKPISLRRLGEGIALAQRKRRGAVDSVVS